VGTGVRIRRRSLGLRKGPPAVNLNFAKAPRGIQRHQCGLDAKPKGNGKSNQDKKWNLEHAMILTLLVCPCNRTVLLGMEMLPV
jgi:hypothetical protein